MSEGKSLIDLGGLSQPATKLIEKISDAIGAVFEPVQIVRLANAKAHASLIEFNSRNTLTELEQRAAQAFIKKETKKQLNIETITSNAISSLPSNASPEELDNDWLSFFFSRCEIVSETMMQKVWGEVLARQATTSGYFNRKTLSTLATMEALDAEIFVDFCSFAIKHEGAPELYIFDLSDQFYRNHGVNLGQALHLQSLGLVHISTESYYLTDTQWPKTEIDDENYYITQLGYFEEKYELLIPEYEMAGVIDDSPRFETGVVTFTTAGAQLFDICNPTPNKKFMKKVGERFKAARQILKQVI